MIGDREFVGHQWLKYLKDRGVSFVMRLPKHHTIHRWDVRIQTVATLALRENKPLTLCNCLVDGVVGHVWVMLLEDGDYLFLFGTVEVKFMGQLYRKRWSIEVCFQNMKKRGFDLEDTHLQDNGKLKKLVALVSIAYAFCASLGIYYHQKVEKIKTKNHGYKANSFVRKGIDLIQDWFRAENDMPDKVINRFLCFIRYLHMLIPDSPSPKIVG